MILVVCKYLPKGITAMALFPFVLIKQKGLAGNAVTLNHERIHLRQQLEGLIVPFYVWYALEYLIRRLQFGGHRQAYRNISFEREAYQNEKDPHYLKQRSFARCLKYL